MLAELAPRDPEAHGLAALIKRVTPRGCRCPACELTCSSDDEGSASSSARHAGASHMTSFTREAKRIPSHTRSLANRGGVGNGDPSGRGRTFGAADLGRRGGVLRVGCLCLSEVEAAFSSVVAQGCGLLELGARFLMAVKLSEEGGTDGGQLGIAGQGGFASKVLCLLQATRGALGHANGNCPVEENDRGWGEVRENGVERDDPRPVGALDTESSSVAGRNGRLQGEGPSTEVLGRLQRGEPTHNEQLVPPAPVLVSQQHGFPVRPRSGG